MVALSIDMQMMNTKKKNLKKKISSIKPLVYAPNKPKILLISQAPSLQAWLNCLNNKSEDGGFVSEDNVFLINDLLPAFGLTKDTLNIFKKNIFWIHSCNCYPFFKRNTKGTRRDYHPNKTQVNNCLGKWIDKLEKIPSLKYIILMGKVATYRFPQLNVSSEGLIKVVRKFEIRKDIIEGIEILPIYHQSKKSRVFNNEKDKKINEKLKKYLKEIIS